MNDLGIPIDEMIGNLSGINVRNSLNLQVSPCLCSLRIKNRQSGEWSYSAPECDHVVHFQADADLIADGVVMVG